jgi:signal transduction histidine kinase
MDPEAYPTPPTVSDEDERLQDLRDLDLVGEPTAPPLEGIPRLAAQLCNRPWGGVTVVQEDTHRFLAMQGPFPPTVPREQSICTHAIARPDECFQVPDLAENAHFRDNPVVDEFGVRFYAGAPIQGPRGHGLGTVCVFGQQPDQLEPSEQEALTILSWFVSTQLQLHQRTRELEQANEELDQFTAFVSHELTDPISQVLSNLDLLARDLQDLDPESRELLDESLAGAKRMGRMLKDLLRYARASGRPLDKRGVNLDELVEDVWAGLASRRQRPDVQLSVGDLPEVEADDQLLRRVVHNLVDNTLEHADAAGEVRVDAREEGQAWRVWVEDDGHGIPPEHADRLFELFEQGPTTRGGSSGVGLALCRRIVERHGGEIGVETGPGEGSRFWFTLPRVQGSSTA